ncbi:DUF924 family protein [Tepidicaulis sp.]|uniref:DUF924 family protein n=1 Tax=Tepidicaulis sp. TaxID=1920809 RepID=UPI003B5BC8E1
MSTVSPAEVLEFWREAGPERWFAKDAAFDAEIIRRFTAARGEALSGAYDDWADEPEGALALIILLDQFSRNIYRDEPRAFEADEKALRLARDAIAKGHDKQLSTQDRVWIYMPFMHAENLGVQEESVKLFEELGIENNLAYAIAHRDVIAKFGRFPHRNALFGRESSAEELAYLKEHGGF